MGESPGMGGAKGGRVFDLMAIDLREGLRAWLARAAEAGGYETPDAVIGVIVNDAPMKAAEASGFASPGALLVAVLNDGLAHMKANP